jgi:hypothetical protein
MMISNCPREHYSDSSGASKRSSNIPSADDSCKRPRLTEDTKMSELSGSECREGNLSSDDKDDQSDEVSGKDNKFVAPVKLTV